MFPRKKPMLEFKMKVTIDHTPNHVVIEYTTHARTATKAIAATFTHFNDEKVVCISGNGKSNVYPRSRLLGIECVFVKELANDKD
jgi:hypothetical protein